MNEDGRAVCGLNCVDCPIYRAPFDTHAASLLLGWFKEMNVIPRHQDVEDLMEGGPYCKGCRGPRATHWSADCHILTCCVDRKELASCYLCDEFPCDELFQWSLQDARYASAFAYLETKHRELFER